MKKIFPSGLRILTWVALSAALITTSCKKDDADNGGNGGEPTPPPVSLTDQFEYDGGDPIDIKSVVYEIDEEDSKIYTFYLSPSEGITTIKGMEKADDYLKLVVLKPHGEVDTSAEDFQISYEDISVSKLTLNTDVERVQLSTNLLDISGQFILYLDVKMKSGKTLLARYNNECVQYKLPVLKNQYALDDAVKKIGSIVEWVDLTAGTTTYYLYEAEGVTSAPTTETPAGVTIQIPSDMDAEKIVDGRLTAGSTLEIDLSTADLSKLSIQSGEFAIAEGATGTLTLTKDRGDDQKLSVTLDVKSSNSRLRASFDNGAIAMGYQSSNHMKITINNEAVVDADLSALYRYEYKGYQFAVGVPDAAAEEPQEGVASLTSGHFSVQFNVAALDLGKTLDLSSLANLESPDDAVFKFYLYDYKTYTTYDPTMASGKGATGTIRTIAVGEDTYYVKIDVQFPNGPSVEAEWYGSYTNSTSDLADVLTPVKPYEPQLIIQKSDGTILPDWTIEQVLVREVTNYYAGENKIADAYVFYFVTEQTAGAYNGLNDTSVTPTLAVPKGENYSFENLKDATDFIWYFKFNNSALKFTSYGTSGQYQKCTPEDSSLTLTKSGDNWNISFRMVDKGYFNSFNPSELGGYDTILRIDWQGPVGKYEEYTAGE